MYLIKSLAALLATSTMTFSTAAVQASPVDTSQPSPVSNSVSATDQEVGLSPGVLHNNTLAASQSDLGTCRCNFRFLFTSYDIWTPVDLYNDENQWGRKILAELKSACGLVRTLSF